ncbi:hypothetical protein J6590_105130, partial [Homalodisca vitripennis]
LKTKEQSVNLSVLPARHHFLIERSWRLGTWFWMELSLGLRKKIVDFVVKSTKRNLCYCQSVCAIASGVANGHPRNFKTY